MALKDGDLMSSGDAAKALGLSIAMVTKIEAKGQLRSVRTTGGLRLFWAKEVTALGAARARTGRGRR